MILLQRYSFILWTTSAVTLKEGAALAGGQKAFAILLMRFLEFIN